MGTQTTNDNQPSDMKNKMAVIEDKASELGVRATDMVDNVTTRAGEQIQTVGSSLRKGGDSAGAALENAGDYLKRSSAGDFADDIGNVMRKHPKTTLAVGLGLGFLAARLISR